MDKKIAQQQDNGLTIRRLTKHDFDAVVAMDAAAIGHPRTVYFERRLKTALLRPALYVQLGAEQGGKLVGFMMARRVQGQFGRSEAALRLEALAVSPDVRGKHIGSALMTRLEQEASRLEIPEIRTTASWRDHAIMQFLDHAGFELGSELAIDCPVADAQLALNATAKSADASKSGGQPGIAADQLVLSKLQPDDLHDIVNIDKRVRDTGQRREAFFYELVDEAMNDSAIRVSLVARVAGSAAGFVMARTNFGDYGRAEPVAVLDTIGVSPDHARQGLGHALLSQLFKNLHELQIGRVETVVASQDFQLLRFFYAIGFKPSQRLRFVKRVARS